MLAIVAEPVALVDAPTVPDPEAAADRLRRDPRLPWLVVHSRPAGEVRTLLAVAERVVTACGFNAMRQMAPFREHHVFHPFSRRFDDQFLRAERVAAGWLSPARAANPLVAPS